jgi:hypothetical protein
MNLIVFVGPSLTTADMADTDDIEFRPPAACGDIARAVIQRPAAIGLIDGLFETTAAPWHKEILWALSRDIAVFGSSSMGALRAAELQPFGMIGVGRVFEAYQNGLIEDDDEVAIQHGPKETGYINLSEALVNIRASLASAYEHGILSAEDTARLIGCAKDIFYKDRTWNNIIEAGRQISIGEHALARLTDWVPRGRINIKHQDARELIRAILEWRPGSLRSKAVEFTGTTYWQELLFRVSRDFTRLTP